MYKKSSLLFLIFHLMMHAKSAIIIIHGTWAKNESWYQSNGKFFKAIQLSNQQLGVADIVQSFRWSGVLDYVAQYEAAVRLASIIEQYDFVILIGHSHGATVGIIASEILARNNLNSAIFHKIRQFYALGVPVERNMAIYPNMSVVHYFFNIFSWGDIIQPIQGIFTRAFENHVGLVNLAITINKTHPSHSRLHDMVIGQHLLSLPTYLSAQFKDDWKQGTISFNIDCCCDQVHVDIESDLKGKLEFDATVQWMMQAAYFRKHKLFV